MADDKTTKTPEQPVTDSGPGKETPPAPQKEPEKVSVSPEPEKKTEPEVKTPQVSVYNFAEIMKEKKAEERAAAPGVEKPDPAKTEKPEKQPEAPKKAEEKPKEPEQPKRRGRPPKADKDKAATPKPKAPAQKPENAVKKEPEKKTAPTVQAAPAPKEPEKPKDAPRRGKEQIVYIKLNELHAFKNHPFEVRDDEEMRAMVSSVKDKGVTQPAIVRPREDGGYEIVSGHRRQKASELAGYADMPCIVRNLTDDEAITQMVEDNLNQREEILPSERAKALKMQLEAIKHQGSRTSGQIDPKDAGKRSNEIVAERNGFGQILIQIQRPRNRAGNLGHLECVRQAGPVMISLRSKKHLCFVFHPAKGFGVENPVPVSLVDGADVTLRFISVPSSGIPAVRRIRTQLLKFPFFKRFSQVQTKTTSFPVICL